jgi:CHAD domain-containing protein
VREVEHKYSFEGDLVLPDTLATDVGARSLVALEPLELKAAYYDTDDFRLARSGVTLRHRSGDEGGDRWTLKLPLDEGRDEIEMDGPATRVPGSAVDLVRAFARAKPLKRVVTLKTKRARWAFLGDDGERLAELVDDHVVVYRSGRVDGRFRELEIESADGSTALIDKVGACLEEHGARPGDAVPKGVRALGPDASAPPDVSVPASVSPSAPASEAIRAAITSATARIQANDPRARLGDPEGIHQMRVGARHLRSDLRTFQTLVQPDWAGDTASELKWLAGVLGDVRDLDVMTERLGDSAGELRDALGPLFDRLKEADKRARDAMLDALRSKRYEQLLESLVEAGALPPVTEAAGAPSSEALPPLVATRWVKLRDAGRAVGESSSDDDLHRVRILAKRARYAAEAASVALGKKKARAATRFADLCSKVQDTLGVQHDTTVAIAAIEEAIRGTIDSVDFVLAAGRLIEREASVATTARSSFERAWDKLDRKKNVAWMKGSE